MGKSLFIAEKPSVAQEFAKVLHLDTSRKNGYLESEDSIITWCVGHLITMSYPEAYDARFKKWSVSTLPFLPEEFKYEVIPAAAGQYKIVKELLTRDDVETIYVCTDSGREGEYIYRLVEQMAGVKGKNRRRVWIDSQTEDEIRRGIREAKDLSAYDDLAESAYLRAKEDYLMGINFSRALTLKYGNGMASYLGKRYVVISAGRVMTCVLGMTVRREREIRNFVKTPFFRVILTLDDEGQQFDGEWRAAEGSRYYNSPLLYKENGFRERKDAEELADFLRGLPQTAEIADISRKRETRNAPLLFNLAELQNECSRRFKISPDATLSIIQELYEKKLVTYPRTDARVVSTAVAREINKNISGLRNFPPVSQYAGWILDNKKWQKLSGTRYVDDSKITDHYAIIPTGQGLKALGSLKGHAPAVYELITRRFLSIFYPPAVYQKVSIETVMQTEHFFSGFRILAENGYLEVMGSDQQTASGDKEDSQLFTMAFFEICKKMRKGMMIPVSSVNIKEGETTPPRRYNSGSMILAMENAGQLIDDEELREQIKGCGIGTSATRAEILKKLFTIGYLHLNSKTQIITPTMYGEMVYDAVDHSIRPLLNPELTASWEKGLTYVAEGTIEPREYMTKLEKFVTTKTNGVISMHNESSLRSLYDKASAFYKKNPDKEKRNERKSSGTGNTESV